MKFSVLSLRMSFRLICYDNKNESTNCVTPITIVSVKLNTWILFRPCFGHYYSRSKSNLPTYFFWVILGRLNNSWTKSSLKMEGKRPFDTSGTSDHRTSHIHSRIHTLTHTLTHTNTLTHTHTHHTHSLTHTHTSQKSWILWRATLKISNPASFIPFDDVCFNSAANTDDNRNKECVWRNGVWWEEMNNLEHIMLSLSRGNKGNSQRM